MRFTTAAVAAVALGFATAATAQIQVVSADQEYALAHPRPAAKAARGDFHATMDQVFGPGRWRETSGYRTRAQEDALRRQGAGTVAPGHTSLHSIGAPDAPGAYDAVVDHMPLATAAAKLKQASGGFSRVLAERAHGPQGAHLHVELVSTGGPAAASGDDAPPAPAVRHKRRAWRMRVASASSAAY
jgi:hypothetical protein